MTYELPSAYDPNDNRRVDIPKALIPIIAGRLRGLEDADAWAADDQISGTQAALLLQERLIPSSFVQTARENAIYAWIASENVGGSGWEDIILGIMASSSSTMVKGELNNGQDGLVFSGYEWLRTGQFPQPIIQPYDIIIAASIATPDRSSQLVDGINGANRCFFASARDGFRFQFEAGTSLYSPNNSADSAPAVLAIRANGGASQIRKNGVVLVQGNGGTAGITGISIGATYGTLNLLNGVIGAIVICAPGKSAIIEESAMMHYGVS